jgi:Excalibur calcium-binding domain
MGFDIKTGLIPVAALATFASVYTLTPGSLATAPSGLLQEDAPLIAVANTPPTAPTKPARSKPRPKAVEYTYREQLAATPQAPDIDTSAENSVYYAGCNQVRAAGLAPLYRGDPGYRAGMDGDDDGIACEPYRGR